MIVYLLRALGWLLFACCPALLSALELAPLFREGMVLQREMAVPVWGWAQSGSTVNVSFGGQTKSTRAGSDGRWLLRLDALKASSQERSLKVEAGGKSVTVSGVVVGEVWVCSGQSNMQWTLGASSRKAVNPIHQPVVDYIAKETQSQSDALLRQIEVPRVVSAFEPRERFKAKWVRSSSHSNGGFSAAAYFFAKDLRRELNVPVGIIACAWGGTRIEPWIPKEGFEQRDTLKGYYEDYLRRIAEEQRSWDQAAEDARYEKMVADWKAENPGKTRLPWKIVSKKPIAPNLRNEVPATLYNGLIHSLVPYAMRGVLWYQGEANVYHHPDDYSRRLTALIESWREVWGQGDFPFYYAQLASYQKPADEPGEGAGWEKVQYQQFLTLSVPETGMAVLNDVGEAEDIHPRNKVDVGRRLARWALAKDYGKSELIYSGPLFEQAIFQDKSVWLRFASVGEGLQVARKEGIKPAQTVDEPLAWFQICGKDGQWQWAEARIDSANTIEVYHPKISEPVEVRYAWSKNPVGANLYNSAGLPASLFKVRRPGH